MTLVVNLYGGPGTGKSTTAALTFGFLKTRGYNAELVTEFAKDLTWEERTHAIRCQPYVFGKQMFKVEKLLGQVEVIVTDSPILLSTVYGADLGPAFRNYVYEVHRTWTTLDVFLRRDHLVHPYNEKGRNQTEAQAREVDDRIRDMLTEYRVLHRTVPVQEADATALEIVALVEKRLEGLRERSGALEAQGSLRG